MSLNLWSVILVASLSQSVFLGAMFALRPTTNKRALSLLLGLLFVLFLIHINNLWYASYLYQSIPGVAGFAMGMILLIGPLIYLYVQSIVKPSFTFHTRHLLHGLPYLLVLSGLIIQDSALNEEEMRQMVDVFMAGEMPVSWPWILRFIFYASHLLFYLHLSRRVLTDSEQQDADNYQVSLAERGKWIHKMSIAFSIIALILVGATFMMLVTGKYSADGNFIITTILSLIIYLIGYQTLLHNQTVLPGFDTRYATLKIQPGTKDLLMEKLNVLFEKEKIFTDPDIKLSSLAERLNTQPHVLSRLINTQLKQSFSELLNQYRIEEFKKKALDPEFSHYSIIGIAYEVGYNSKSSFNTAFKKQTGLTPSQFLKKS
ncbi:AraC family transcriptional regulator [bacterium SCSIO 12741]|nr:AraC family transcriptional regulator [bacterium SCSIO 12741]